MKDSVIIQLLLLVHVCFCCVYCVNVTIDSIPQSNGGIIHTEQNETVSLTCSVGSSTGGEKLQWYQNERPVRLKDGNNQDVSHLCLNPVISRDNGVVFTCKLKANANVNASIHLDVTYPPDLNYTEEVKVEETTHTVLSCEVHANPPVMVVWKKDGELLDLSLNSYKTSNNGITAALYISNIKRGIHQGVYSCETTSSKYGVNTKIFSVTVEDKVLKFPLGPTIFGLVVVAATILLAVFSRRHEIIKCFKKSNSQ